VPETAVREQMARQLGREQPPTLAHEVAHGQALQGERRLERERG
jgi:hypothetical protein